MSGVEESAIKEFWGGENVEWSTLDAVGASEGTAILWRKDFLNLRFSFRGEGFLGLCVEKEGSLIYFVNVYAACELNSRRSLWKSLIDFKLKNVPGSWCVGGDFNNISNKEERIDMSNRSYKKEIYSFKAFIEEMELVDPPTMGGKFTWFKNNGKSMSRIDRFWLSDCFMEKWKIMGQYIGGRDLSDHAPIWLNENRKDWGPKAFKFNNSWLKHKEFNDFMEKEWGKIIVNGRGDFVLSVKLKAFKRRLVWWNKEVYG
ncbi:uncharacterized protein LOC131659082 [Vicia villosa]|uniref:uncharacterized protein LOC131659082 n=1 Tax=Vicia villosa TaxID=3911 RepID=UPI00273C2135|nr:uncharacterized protein LOC131659082 [Vicia villosa]